mmetsp:Transcript_10485/g.23077  ORF Transcript_10485/g.23077 Transcript_10485/m.23077 type:complete len:547 (-) Transcript_10485:244-1884(-)
MPTGAPIEVRKSAESATWYNAFIADVGKTTITVSFEDEVWPSRDVSAPQVRLRPVSDADSAVYTPAAGDAVEVEVTATEATPSGWARGKVKTIRNQDFYYVVCESSKPGAPSVEVIVEREKLRRVSTQPTINLDEIERRLLPVDKRLWDWVLCKDSFGCLDDVALRTQLLVCSTITHQKSPKVLLVGDEPSVRLAERLLVEIHFKNQIRIQGFHEYRERYLELIKEYEQQWGTWHKEVFTVTSTFVGRIIGTKGANISKLREEYGVEISIDDESSTEATVTVSGEDAEKVKEARENMEYITAAIEVDPDQVGWIVGKGYQNLQEIQTKADLIYARYDDATASIELCGLRRQVEDAKLMVAVHRDYLSVYQGMSDEREKLKMQWEELDKKGGKGRKGAGKDKGRKGDEFDQEPGMGKSKGKGKYDEKGEKGDKGKGQKGEKGSKGKGKKGKYDDYDDYDDDEYEEEVKGKGKRKSGKSKDEEKGKGKAKGKGDKGKGEKGKWYYDYDDDEDDDEALKGKGKGKSGKSEKGKGKSKDKDSDDWRKGRK